MKIEKMTSRELASALGKRPEWVVAELRRDAKRESKQWPFATSTQSKSGRWSYVINRLQFEKWNRAEVYSGHDVDYERLTDMVANRVADVVAERIADLMNKGDS